MRRFWIFIAALLLSSTLWAQENAAADNSNNTKEVATSNEATPQSEVATTPRPAAELSSEELWAMGNDAYTSGDYAKAVESYNAILEQGLHSAQLHYNLANAYFKQGELGEALLHYNRAYLLAPADEDIRHNMEYAEKMTKDSIEEIPPFFLTTWINELRSSMSCTAWTILSLVLLAIALSLALGYLLGGRMVIRKAGFYGMCISSLLFIIATAMAWGERDKIVERKGAIVMSSAASIKSSPDKAATELFVLHEGTKLITSESVNGWVEVRIADGRKGWIEESRIERI